MYPFRRVYRTALGMDGVLPRGKIKVFPEFSLKGSLEVKVGVLGCLTLGVPLY